MAIYKRIKRTNMKWPLLKGPMRSFVWYMHKAAFFYPVIDGVRKSTRFPDQDAITIEGKTYTHEELAAACGFEPLHWRTLKKERDLMQAEYEAAKAKHKAGKVIF